MDLPNELILEVCKYLPKSDLKACRLVSKSWSHHASNYLFSKIYISPRQEDIEVFSLITQHAQLSNCVKSLEYDGTNFSPSYSYGDYVYHLFKQAADFSDLYRMVLNSTVLQLTQSTKPCSKISATLVAALQKIWSHAVVMEGHREWKVRDDYQQSIVKSGEFLRILTRGLRKLDRLNSVEVCKEWHTVELSDSWRSRSSIDNMDLSDPYFYGSPFGRAWGFSHPIPHGWVEETPDLYGSATGREEFQIITTALSQSQRHIRSFHVPRPPVSIFGPNVTKILVDHIINAYSSLEVLRLSLHLNEYTECTGMTARYKFLPDLQALLGSSGGLRHLELTLPRDNWDANTFFNYRQIFPTDDTQWTRLTNLSIDALAISVKDLVHLLTSKMPSLRELTFSEIKLVEGRWEGVIEFLKTSMHLLSFPLPRSCQLLHLEGRVFLDDMGADEDGFLFRKEIETYVISGGRHPCLRPDEDVSASRKYLLDLGL